MFKKCLPLLALLLIAMLQTTAQNVFDPNDSVYTYNPAAPLGTPSNPNVPANNVMAKWIRTPDRITWNTNKFKSYIWNGVQFRLRYPNNYNPAQKYPIMVFFHGGGERGDIYDNEDQLYWGASIFEERINYNYWNGFLLFPQQDVIFWDNNVFPKINSIVDTLTKYTSADIDRLMAIGLSAGGYGSVAYMSAFPQRVAATAPSSPSYVRTLNYNVQDYKHIPIWITHGASDYNPTAYDANGFCDDVRSIGGNIYQQFLGTEGHFTWYYQWNHFDANNQYIMNNFWMNAHKAQPLLFYNNGQFCPGSPISAKMGITAGFNTYEWQRDGGSGFATIAGATSNEYTATQAGLYRVRFKRTASSSWSDWTPNPISITVKASCSPDTAFAEHFENVPVTYSATTPYAKSQFDCVNGVVPAATELFSHDGLGRQGGGFLVHYTTAHPNYTYASNDKVWGSTTPVTVLPNTNYVFSFYLANQSATNPAQIVPRINGTALSGFVQASGVGNASWTKFTFNWNSGAATTADLSLHNLLAVTTGNDFALDEIAFVKLAGSLPAQWVDFTVAKQNETAALKWITTNEVNSRNYEVEHSTDGVNWNSIGIVNSANGTGNNNYAFTHTSPAKGINYYRIKQVDLDGRYQYSLVKRIVFGKTGSLLVYPNPTRDKVSVQTTGVLKAVTVYNTAGQLMLQQTFSNSTAGRVHDVFVNQLQKGIYILQITTAAGDVENLKLVKE